MTRLIEGNAGDANKGKWDVATVPGGGGNWGGSCLAVPTQSKHPKEAAELAEFLTSAEQQIAAFKAGRQPAVVTRRRCDDPDAQGVQNAYFNNAPVGQIFGDRRQEPQAGLPRPEEPGRQRRGGERPAARRAGHSSTPQDAWADAVKDASRPPT